MDKFRARRAEARRDRPRPSCEKHFAFSSAGEAFAVLRHKERQAAAPVPAPALCPINAAYLNDDDDGAWPFAMFRSDEGYDAPAPRVHHADPGYLFEEPAAYAPPEPEPIEPVEQAAPVEPPVAASAPLPVEISDAPKPMPVIEEGEEPPFDPPDEDDDIFGGRSSEEEDEATTAERPEPQRAGAPAAPSEASAAQPLEMVKFSELPLPPISILASWDRPEIAQMFASFAAHPQIARADITIIRGGVDGAVVRLGAHPSPDLLILDSTLGGKEMLRGLDRLAKVMAPTTKLVVLGAVNDITLLRELTNRGASHYIVGAVKQDELIRAVCGLYEASDKSRVIAVIGARGGVGASTIASNLAWSIAERQRVGAALVDLDLPFGTAAFQVNASGQHSVADVLSAPEDLDNGAIDRLSIKHTERLRILNAPARLDRAMELNADTVAQLIKRVRRTSSFVVLDLPHCWTSWIKSALIDADEVIIVANPDLTSLRNAKNMLDLLETQRAKPASVALTMVGVPKRPEITPKDFAEAIGADPIATFAFDPDVFGLAMMKSATLGQAASDSKAARTIDELAASFAGDHASKAEPAPSLAPFPAALEPLVLVNEAPPEADLDPSAEALVVDLQNEREKRGSSAFARPRRSGASVALIATTAAAVILAGAWYAQTRAHLFHLNGAQAEAAAYAPTQSTPAPRPAAPAVLDPPSAYQAALEQIRNGQVEDGVALLQRSANGGFALAQYRLAKLYEFGDDVSADPELARQWTERAAAGGNRHAMHDLAVYMAHGEGGALDEAGAARWFGQAAQLGLADSQFNLALAFEQGRGVTKSAPDAMYWYLVAAHNGYPAAADRAVALENQLSADQVTQAHARADAFQPTAPDPSAN